MGVGMASATRYTKTAKSLMSILVVGSLLGLSLHSYLIQEVVVCYSSAWRYSNAFLDGFGWADKTSGIVRFAAANEIRVSTKISYL
jgi:hypothetical protein